VVRRDWGWCPPFYTRRSAGETTQRRWAAVTSAAAIKVWWGLGGRPFQGRKGRGWLGVVTVGCSAHWREGEEARGGRSAPGQSGSGGHGRKGGRLEVGDGPDRWAPPVSGA
jgi:hypothetical protein